MRLIAIRNEEAEGSVLVGAALARFEYNCSIGWRGREQTTEEHELLIADYAAMSTMTSLLKLGMPFLPIPRLFAETFSETYVLLDTLNVEFPDFSIETISPRIFCGMQSLKHLGLSGWYDTTDEDLGALVSSCPNLEDISSAHLPLLTVTGRSQLYSGVNLIQSVNRRECSCCCPQSMCDECVKLHENGDIDDGYGYIPRAHDDYDSVGY